jgi:predicted Zn finger-like uncharacterized protein
MAGPQAAYIRSFTCPNCQALYYVVKGERGLETVDRQVACRVCGASFPGREGDFVLKYFLLGKAARPRGRQQTRSKNSD